jgi:O-antigen/teichoic acid export membrane protein
MGSVLGKRIVSGVGWTLAGSIAVRLMQLLVTVVLARILPPSAFGLFALGQMIVIALTLFRELGFGQALIYHKENIQRDAETTFVLSSAFGILAWACVYVTSPLIASVFGGSSLIWPLRIMSLSVTLTAFSTVPSTLLEKELRFRRRALPEFALGITYAIVSITLAVYGFGVWSLVYGYLASTAASSIVMWLVAGWKPVVSFHLDSAYRTLGFGKYLMASSMLGLIFFYTDNASVGRWLGVTALGFYNLAYTVCNLPATNISNMINKVMYPAYSKLNDNIAAMRSAYISTVKSIALISFPIAAWLALAPGDFVRGFLNDKWLPAIPLFRILAFYGMFRSIGATAGSVFMAVGQPKWIYKLNIVQLIIAVPLVYPVAIRYGTIGVAVLFTIAYIAGTSLALWKALHILEMTILEFIVAFRTPFIATATVIASYLIADHILPSGIAVAATSAFLSLVSYTTAVIMLDKEAYRNARSILSPKLGEVYANIDEGKGSS